MHLPQPVLGLSVQVLPPVHSGWWSSRPRPGPLPAGSPSFPGRRDRPETCVLLLGREQPQPGGAVITGAAEGPTGPDHMAVG